MRTSIDIDQNTNDVDQRIREFMDRKVSPLGMLSTRIMERLAPSIHGAVKTKGAINYEPLHWHRITSHTS